jgi:hypothetical protein
MLESDWSGLVWNCFRFASRVRVRFIQNYYCRYVHHGKLAIPPWTTLRRVRICGRTCSRNQKPLDSSTSAVLTQCSSHLCAWTLRAPATNGKGAFASWLSTNDFSTTKKTMVTGKHTTSCLVGCPPINCALCSSPRSEKEEMNAFNGAYGISRHITVILQKHTI